MIAAPAENKLILLIRMARNEYLVNFLIQWTSIQKQQQGVLWKKVFSKISQNSQESTCVWVSFLIKLQAWRPATSSKRDSNTTVFIRMLKMWTFSRTLILKNIYERLLLSIPCSNRWRKHWNLQGNEQNMPGFLKLSNQLTLWKRTNLWNIDRTPANV